MTNRWRGGDMSCCLKGVNIKVPAGVTPQTRQMIDQWREGISRMAVHLPEQAIGLGAKWQTSTAVRSQGLEIAQTTTSELLSMEGERLTTANTVVQSAGNQEVSNPSMPSLKVNLTKMTGSGQGKATYDLGKIMPSEGKIDFHAEVSMAMKTGGQDQDIETKTDLHLEIGELEKSHP